MLSEDEMKVIERIEDTFYQDNGKGIKRFQKITLYEDGISDILKLLNIFEKLQKEIEHQKEKRENQKVELAILNEKQKEMNKLKNTVSSYYGMFKKQEKQIKELQKENEIKIKGFENEELICSKFTEKVGKDIIDYKFEYENNQKIIDELQKENEEKDKEIETLKRDFKIVDQECSRLERKEAKQDKIIDLMAEYMEENMDEYQLDKIYAKQYNCNGMERNWTRGKEKEVKDIKQYFERKVKKCTEDG